ncbi:MAG TPA: DUF2254 domain-containing protein [Acidimicrobiales bacterium]|nr:DUF2254 domain-containing protein [Acidimicrobiales bacterium]
MRRPRLPGWRREALRTTLWLVPIVCVVAAVVLFVTTYELDQAVYRGSLDLPSWIRTGSADAGRAVLIGIAAAVITVVGVVFSITILALTLASQQFGPRMLRTFIRDLGTQVTLGVFVASFVYAVLALGSITEGSHGHPAFVPHISITIAEFLMFLDIAFLIYFIHHIAVTIQLPEVIATIAGDLGRAIDETLPEPLSRVTTGAAASDERGPTVAELSDLLDTEGLIIPATRSGYLQFVGYAQLLAIAEGTDTVIRLVNRPGHFVLAGRPLAWVWPAARAEEVRSALASAHITGPQRTLAQDPVFPIDQLVEIAIRALSPAVNDTFTALTCIDWLSDGLSNISGRHFVEGVYRDRAGVIRLIEPDPSYARMVNRAVDKVRQAARGMPAVLIRLMDALANVAEYTISAEQRQVLRREADMVLRASVESIVVPEDLSDLKRRYARFEQIVNSLDSGVGAPRSWPKAVVGARAKGGSGPGG